jgi:hypothetical protein
MVHSATEAEPTQWILHLPTLSTLQYVWKDFSTVGVIQLSRPHTKADPSQDSTLAYSPCIYSVADRGKTPTRKIFFSMLYVFYTFYLLLPFPLIYQITRLTR